MDKDNFDRNDSTYLINCYRMDFDKLDMISNGSFNIDMDGKKVRYRIVQIENDQLNLQMIKAIMVDEKYDTINLLIVTFNDKHNTVNTIISVKEKIGVGQDRDRDRFRNKGVEIGGGKKNIKKEFKKRFDYIQNQIGKLNHKYNKKKNNLPFI